MKEVGWGGPLPPHPYGGGQLSACWPQQETAPGTGSGCPKFGCSWLRGLPIIGPPPR